MSTADEFRTILTHYPAEVARVTWTRLGPAGGFSGATVWRGELAGSAVFALKSWPASQTVETLPTIHHLMTVARTRFGLGFVPAVVATRTGETVVAHDGGVWDLTAWMPGAADYHSAPSPARLAAACGAVAAIHRAWAPPVPVRLPCPGVRRRLAVLADFPAVAAAARRGSGDPSTDALVRRATAILPAQVAAAAELLAPWAGRPVAVQPCLCDVWHDHVLFTGDRVTGVIDYGAVKPDHPAVDLARLLGDLVGDDDEQFRRGLDAYRAAGGPVAIDAGLTRLLDRTGVVCAALRWVRDLSSGAPPANAAAARLGRFLDRLESQPVRQGRDR